MYTKIWGFALVLGLLSSVSLAESIPTVNVYFCMYYGVTPRTPITYNFKVDSSPSVCMPKVGQSTEFPVFRSGITCSQVGIVEPACFQSTIWSTHFDSEFSAYWGQLLSRWSLTSTTIEINWWRSFCGFWLCSSLESCHEFEVTLPLQGDSQSLYILGNPWRCNYEGNGRFDETHDGQSALHMHHEPVDSHQAQRPFDFGTGEDDPSALRTYREPVDLPVAQRPFDFGKEEDDQ